MPFVTVLETDDNHDGLIDTFDIQARALAAATEQRRLLDRLNTVGRTYSMRRTARQAAQAGTWRVSPRLLEHPFGRGHRPTRRCTPVLR